ncbi:MAG: 3-hydroxyacyl-CoA dehydrogenase NAD-binding domain-containing protein [Gaiellaceae bacterium]
MARPSEFRLQRAGDLALVTLDNSEDETKPTALGPEALESLAAVLDTLETEEWAGLVLTGKPSVFCVGADIDQFPDVTPERAREGSRAGHGLFGRLAALPFPTLAAINGACLGGGVELALHCDHRTISTAVRHFGCPEVFLGLFPAWGGTQVVPRLVGPEAAINVLVEYPLARNRMLDGAKAFGLGLADALLEPEDFLDESIAFLAAAPPPRVPADLSELAASVSRARARVDDQVHGAAPAPYVCLDLIEGAGRWTIEEGYRAEEDAIAELLPGPQAQASLYAFHLVERRAKRQRPPGEPRPVEKVGIVGAGLMATQIAALMLKRLEVPLVLKDVDETVVERALAELGDQGAVSGGTTWAGFEDCDLVLEAVVEQLPVKQQVFAELRELAKPGCVVATNTSSLSVAAMGADLGLHFFNPVALMPLVELVVTPDTPEGALATAHALTRQLRKTGVVVKDSPGFVVNRLLTRLTAVLMDALEHGNTVEETDEAILRLGLPMAPSFMLQLVGPRVAYNTLETMHAAFPDRFPLSPTLRNYAEGRDEIVVVEERPRSVNELTDDVLDALTDEIERLLEEGVVAEAADVDTCLLLGAGFPFFLGGITPYLRSRGAALPA